MERRGLVGSLFWAAVGCVFCAGSLCYGFGTAGVPGAGFLPFLTGMGLLGLSILQVALGIMKGRSQPSHPVRTGSHSTGAAKRVSLVLGALLFYLLALERLGFAVTSVVFLGAIVALDSRRWLVVLLVAFSFTAFFYVLFRVLLRVPLPLGILGG